MTAPLGARVSHGLRKCHELLVRQLKGLTELRTVDRPPEDCCEPFGGAEQIDVLADKADIDRGVETSLFGRDISHTFAMSDVHKVERCGSDKILKPGLRAEIFLQVRQQLMVLRLVQPDAVGHHEIDIDDHDMAPIGSSPIATCRAIDAEGS